MPDRRYPRTARIGRLLQEVVAEELERIAVAEERLELITVTHVSVEPDLRHATVLLSSMDEAAEQALGEVRLRLQAAIGRQVRLKRTPQLSFVVDPAVSSGERVEEILRHLEKDDGTLPEP
jgi:ribosome-binding factor A